MYFGKTGYGIVTGLLIVGLASGTAGCGTRQATPSPADYRGVKVQSTTPGAVRPSANPNEVAAHLERLAKGVKGVRGANCVVFGKYAIVGIDVDPKLDRSRVGTIKYAVAEAFRKDPYGIDALVTADVDLGQRLREIRADAQQGRPIAGFAEELADIVGRLVPQLPRSVVPPASPDGNAGARRSQVDGATVPPHNHGSVNR